MHISARRIFAAFFALIGVISALILLFVPIVPGGATMKARIAVAELGVLEGMLELAQERTGSYPEDLQELADFRPDTDAQWIENDPWGRRWMYLPWGSGGSAMYDLYSTGADGVDDKKRNDDITRAAGASHPIYKNSVSPEMLVGLVTIASFGVAFALSRRSGDAV